MERENMNVDEIRAEYKVLRLTVRNILESIPAPPEVSIGNKEWFDHYERWYENAMDLLKKIKERYDLR